MNFTSSTWGLLKSGLGRAVLMGFLLPIGAGAARAEIGCPEHWSAKIGRVQGLSHDISQIWDAFDAPRIERHGSYAFTDRPGNFLVLNCSDGQRHPTEMQEFYPIGTLLRPLRVLVLDDDETDTYTDPLSGVTLRVPRTYLLVQTEHGHLKVIRERDVQYMVSGATYFFAKSNTRIYLCSDVGNCPGNQREVTRDDGTLDPVCDAARCRDYTAIDPMGGYAVGGAWTPAQGDPRTDWGRVAAARRAIAHDGFENVSDQMRDDQCRPFRVTAYQRGGRPRLLSAEREHLTLCRDRAEGRLSPIRAVSRDDAAAIFDDLAEGIFFRRFGRGGTTLSAILDPTEGPEQEGRKECLQTVTDKIVQSLELSVGARILSGIFSFGGEASRTSSASLETILAEDEYLRFSNFIAPDFYGETLRGLDRGLILNLIFIAACDGQIVQAPKAVALNYPSFLDQRMEINFQSLINTYDALQSVEGRPLPGLIKITSADSIRAGRFYAVPDIDSYYRWKATLAEHLRRETSLRSVLQDFDDGGRRQVIQDFFTHLMMAALFRYDIDTEFDSDTGGGL